MSRGNPIVTCRFPRELLERLDQQCERDGVDRSDAIRLSVSYVLDEIANRPPPPPPKRRRPKRR